MTYEIIQPPFPIDFFSMTKQQLATYNQWFHAVLGQRTEELTRAVTRTPGFANWEPDLTADSLCPLGEWFCDEVTTGPRTDRELRKIESELSFPIDIPTEELADRTLSLAMDIGMYFGQVIIRNVPGTRWGQDTKNRRYVEYGQPVINGAGKVPLNPVRIALTVAYAISRKKRDPNELRQAYGMWTEMLTRC